MTRIKFWIVVLFSVLLIGPSRLEAGPESSNDTLPSSEYEVLDGLLPGDYIILGVVKDIEGGMIKVDTGELQPLYLPIKMAQEKGILPINKGDRLTIVLNDENLVVDFHHFGEPGPHSVLRGVLVTPLLVGHDRAVIRTEDGQENLYEVRPLARSRVARIPIGKPALFLVDEANKITDAFWGSREALDRSEREYVATKWSGSPTKAADTRLRATIVKPLKNGTITVRTEDGTQRLFDTRPLAQEKLAPKLPGEDVILLLDQENKVLDIAAPKRIKG
jgi:hypothetical protein